MRPAGASSWPASTPTRPTLGCLRSEVERRAYAEQRFTSPGVAMIGDEVIWDGEAEVLGVAPLKRWSDRPRRGTPAWKAKAGPKGRAKGRGRRPRLWPAVSLAGERPASDPRAHRPCRFGRVGFWITVQCPSVFDPLMLRPAAVGPGSGAGARRC